MLRSCVCAFDIAAVLVLGWREVQRWLGHQTAEVASITLEDESIHIKVEQIAKAVVDQLLNHYLNDSETQNKAASFIASILSRVRSVRAVRAHAMSARCT